jgi:phospholipase C
MKTTVRQRLRSTAAVSMIGLMLGQPALAQSQVQNPEQAVTETPIKHLIFVVGENRSFDNIFATYKPNNGQQVWNLLSQGIVNDDGTPGPNFAKVSQNQVTASNGSYELAPQNKQPYTELPVPTLQNADSPAVGLEFGIVNADGTPTALFPQGDPDLTRRAQILLATGGAPASSGTDTRVVGADHLLPGPYQQTGPTLPFDSYEGDTIHQMFQMWQQSDCSIQHATKQNPTGCLHDLYPFVATTYSTAPGQVAGDGSQDMAFYNVNIGDAPYFKTLADEYEISDNFHQSINGGSVTGAIAIGYGDNAFYSDGNGNAAVPPGAIMNPDPMPGSINTYKVVGNWVKCSDLTQPGVAQIQSYLASLPYFAGANCDPNKYYATRDVSPAYDSAGHLASPSASVIPPLTQRHIGDVMSEANVSWAWYAAGWDSSVLVANGAKDIFNEISAAGYSSQTNPFNYSKSIMADPTQRAAHIKDVTDNLFDDIANDTLPSVAFVKPDSATDGHPGTSKSSLFEAFVFDLIARVKANPKLFAETAIVISEDESGGLYDSGFIQPLDFFGDGPRIMMILVSPYSTGGKVSHSYMDQASVLKFIERNWRLRTISNRSRDNLPNPISTNKNPWVPTNMPAIDDMFDMFDFSKQANKGN